MDLCSCPVPGSGAAECLDLMGKKGPLRLYFEGDECLEMNIEKTCAGGNGYVFGTVLDTIGETLMGHFPKGVAVAVKGSSYDGNAVNLIPRVVTAGHMLLIRNQAADKTHKLSLCWFEYLG